MSPCGGGERAHTFSHCRCTVKNGNCGFTEGG
ncbi:hypothetical protein SFR_4874 [Streptomyces sp. FR-008]|nr:hypothetical protein SFR_4874 [Streptomyces sp. FR-008]